MIQIYSEITNWKDKKFFILSNDKTDSKIDAIHLNDVLNGVPAHKLLSRHKGKFSGKDKLAYILHINPIVLFL